MDLCRIHSHSMCRYFATLLALACFFGSTNVSWSQAAAEQAFDEPLPLHETIDRIVQRSTSVELGPPANDADFLRRVSLDLVGTVPSVEELRTFLEDPAPNKREKAIDRLLDDPRHAMRMAGWFDLTLMERRRKVHIEQKDWQSFLQTAFENQTPLNELAAQIVAADGTDAHPRAATKFYFARNVEPHLLTRDLGRVFFGRDFQCAQCHDHPHIDDYYQADYFGIFACVNRTYLFKDKDNKVFVADKAEGDVEFTSVFTGDEGSTGPRLPSSERLIEPILPQDQWYVTAPADGIRPVPKFSRRTWLADEIRSGSNRAFNRNWANRLWAIMFGKGLVHPLDLHHSDNPASHPELLDALETALLASEFDTRTYLKEIALSQTYQRSFSLEPTQLLDAEKLQTKLAQLKKLESELAIAVEHQLKQIATQKPDYFEAVKISEDAVDAWMEAKKSRVAMESELRTLSATRSTQSEQLGRLRERQRLLGEANQQLEVARTELALDQASLPTAIVAQAIGKLTPEVEKLTKALAESQPIHDELPAKITAALATESNLDSQRQSTLETYEQATSQWRVLQQKKHSASTRAFQNKQSIAYLEQSLAALALIHEYNNLVAKAEQVQQRIAETDQQVATLQNQQLAARKQLELETKARTENASAESSYRTIVERESSLVKELTNYRDALAAAGNAFSTDSSSPNAGVLTSLLNDASSRLESCTTTLANQQGNLAKLQTEAEAIRQRLETADSIVKRTSAELDVLRTEREAAASRHSKLQDQLAALSPELDTAKTTWLEQSEQRLLVADLRPLTPEQLAWSIMTVTGTIENTKAAVRAELEKESPLTAEQQADAAQLEQRRRTIQKKVVEKLQPTVNVFVSLFGHGPGQPQDGFFATVDQSLFFANAGTVQGWIGQGGKSLYQRLRKLKSADEVASELYLSVYGRAPTPDEILFVGEFLASAGDQRDPVLRELIWALITSAEFRFNH